jgi:hypothetical protein
MADSPTIEELERRLDKLCDEYLKYPHDKYMQREIIDLARRLDELKEGEKKKWTEASPGVRGLGYQSSDPEGFINPDNSTRTMASGADQKFASF